jgi:cyclopropane fatty-acyl-phospholipid synthase-like methyltransferase
LEDNIRVRIFNKCFKFFGGNPLISGAADDSGAWAGYWNAPTIWSDSALWNRQMQVLLELIEPFVKFGAADRVLDFGCGSGIFAMQMQGRVKEIVCADLSQHAVELCQQKFASRRDVSVVKLTGDLAQLAALGPGCTKTLCLSVIQYFPSLHYLDEFIVAVGKISVRGGQLILVDVGRAERTWREQLLTVLFTLRHGMFWQVVAKLAQVQFSDDAYQAVLGRAGHLEIPETYFESAQQRLRVKVSEIPRQLTLNANRKSYIIEFV